MAGQAGRQYGRWANAQEIEHLSKTKTALDNVMGWLLTYYLDRAANAPDAERAEWAGKADQVEQIWTWMAKDLERWITERCQGAESTPGC